ncbi:hypothetical protein EVAR_40064_1 [Eumeta japonica]|uniref:Uncharacterized protein n=1 Tax=Eumeta variegata TaxID=151549 RepID=A0A4C1W8H9_EUMVA|nr:hypothetical protein EVAR_40064_1 [Eumeta japonica]
MNELAAVFEVCSKNIFAYFWKMPTDVELGGRDPDVFHVRLGEAEGSCRRFMVLRSFHCGPKGSYFEPFALARWGSAAGDDPRRRRDRDVGTSGSWRCIQTTEPSPPVVYSLYNFALLSRVRRISSRSRRRYTKPWRKRRRDKGDGMKSRQRRARTIKRLYP